MSLVRLSVCDPFPTQPKTSLMRKGVLFSSLGLGGGGGCLSWNGLKNFSIKEKVRNLPSAFRGPEPPGGVTNLFDHFEIHIRKSH